MFAGLFILWRLCRGGSSVYPQCSGFVLGMFRGVHRSRDSLGFWVKFDWFSACRLCVFVLFSLVTECLLIKSLYYLLWEFWLSSCCRFQLFSGVFLRWTEVLRYCIYVFYMYFKCCFKSSNLTYDCFCCLSVFCLLNFFTILVLAFYLVSFMWCNRKAVALSFRDREVYNPDMATDIDGQEPELLLKAFLILHIQQLPYVVQRFCKYYLILIEIL